MQKPNKYKIHKGIQKEIRFLFLERSIALEFMGYSVLSVAFLILVFSMSFTTLILSVIVFILMYSYFKRKDKKNTKSSLKKMKQNKKKPQLVSVRPTIIIKNEGSIFDKG